MTLMGPISGPLRSIDSYSLQGFDRIPNSELTTGGKKYKDVKIYTFAKAIFSFPRFPV